jgi:hypothetical protein
LTLQPPHRSKPVGSGSQSLNHSTPLLQAQKSLTLAALAVAFGTTRLTSLSAVFVTNFTLL